MRSVGRTPFVVSVCAALGLLTAAATGRAQTAQDPPHPAAEVREMIDAARNEIDAYKKAGGAAASADHPAITWDAELWKYRDRAASADTRTMATVEAIRLLMRAELWDRAHARVDSVDVNDSAWERMPSVLYYDDGSGGRDFAYAVAKLTQTVASTTIPSIKSSALLALGRIQRRQGDNAAAIRSLENAIDAAPGTPSAAEADGIIYEITYLSIGLPAPVISAKARNGRTLDLAALRGKPVVLLFWGST
jgi:hypothetical protein